MFKRILVPLDGSARAERALPVAARLAKASGGSVFLLQVVNTASEVFPTLSSQQTMIPADLMSELADAERYLKGLTLSQPLKEISTETMALAGSVAFTILSAASSLSADLIVICSHGYTGITRWVMGSVAEKVARYAPVPVLVLRESGPIPAGPHPDATRPLRVLVPLDGSVHAKAALVPAASLIAALATPAQGALHLVRVVQLSSKVGHEREQSIEQTYRAQKARGYLERTTEHLREGWSSTPIAELDLHITWSVAVDADVAAAIVRVAENGEDAEGVGVFGGCDVIAMATHGRTGLQRWSLGSITERVLHGTKLPLLIVRPPELVNHLHPTRPEATIATPQG